MVKIKNKGIKKILSKFYPYLHYVEENVIPDGLEGKDPTSGEPAEYIGHAGIDMRDTDQLASLSRWKRLYGEIFTKLRTDPMINLHCAANKCVHNGFYSTPDAEVYTATILDHKPANIIEVGSGFSTMIARRAVNELNNGCKITVIDPQPRTNITDFADDISYKRVEDIAIDDILSKPNSIIFIDSSHIIRSGGDLPYVYNKLLPNLLPGTPVHVHDIFIPYDYPVKYQNRLYTEQYILQALLTHSNKFKVLFAAHYMCHNYLQLMRESISECIGGENPSTGGSFWFEAGKSGDGP